MHLLRHTLSYSRTSQANNKGIRPWPRPPPVPATTRHLIGQPWYKRMHPSMWKRETRWKEITSSSTGDIITMARFPEGIFDTVEPQRVPTIAAMDSLIGALPPGANYFPGPQEGAADTELITRDMLSLYHRRTCQWYSRDTRHQGSTGWNWLVLSGTTTDRTNGRHSKSDTQLNYIRQSKELSRRQSNWTRTQWTLYCLPHISTGETSTLWISYQLTPYHQRHFAQFATTQDGPTSPVNSLQHHSEWQPQCCPT